jgi:hypothetical protein
MSAAGTRGPLVFTRTARRYEGLTRPSSELVRLALDGSPTHCRDAGAWRDTVCITIYHNQQKSQADIEGRRCQRRAKFS